MPRSARTFIISSSDIPSTRSPLTQMTPASGLSSPRISFRIVDFPAPLAPRMIFVSPGDQREADVPQNDLVVEGERHLVEDHDRRTRAERLFEFR